MKNNKKYLALVLPMLMISNAGGFNAKSFDRANKLCKKTEVVSWVKNCEEKHLGFTEFDGVVGKHRYLKINKYSDEGWQLIKAYDSWIQGGTLDEYTISVELEQFETTVVAFSGYVLHKYAADISTALGVKEQQSCRKHMIGNEFKTAFGAERTMHKSQKIKYTYKFNSDIIKDKNIRFRPVLIGYVQKIDYTIYEAHDLWWNHKKVLDNTIHKGSAYLIDDMTKTFETSNGGFIITE